MASTKAKAARHGSEEKKKLDRAAEEQAGESSEARVFPESEANTAKDHATSAQAIAAQVSPAAGQAGAAQVNAAQIDATSEQLDRQDQKRAEDEDKSLFGRIARSGLVFNRDNVNGDEWVGPSIQTEGPEFNHRKGKTSVTPLTSIAPRTGMLVRPKGLTGDSFTVPDGFGPDKNPDAWGAVSKPDGSSLFG